MKFDIYERLIVDSASPKNAAKWAFQAVDDPDITDAQSDYLQELCKYQANEINKKRRQNNNGRSKKRKRR